MLEVANPLWLAGLVLVPAVRRLHRYKDVGFRFPVSSHVLWRSVRAADGAGPALRQPDPAWRRRAAAVAAIILALAGVSWRTGTPAVTVWVDDSLSMATIESGGASRWELAETALAEAFKGFDGEAIARPLSDPALSWRLPREDGRYLPGLDTTGREPAPPALLDPARQHWLLTDGADRHLDAWATAAALTRILQVGSPAPNLAVYRAGARRDADSLEVLVSIENHGDLAETRRLVVESDGTLLGARSVTLDPGTAISLVIPAAGATGSITARLEPPDALAGDDALAIDLAAMEPAPARLGRDCPPALRAAVSAHPGLRPVSATGSGELDIVCGVPVTSDGPALVFVNGAPMGQGTAAWVAADDRLRSVALPDAPLRVLRMPDGVVPSARVLMTVGANPAVCAPRGPDPVLYVALDLADETLTGDPAFPLLISALAGSVVGRPLLVGSVQSARDRGASEITPLALPAISAPPTGATVSDAVQAGPWFLWLAVVLIALDALGEYRRGGIRLARGPAR